MSIRSNRELFDKRWEEYDKAQADIQNKIRLREKQIERLNKKLNNLKPKMFPGEKNSLTYKTMVQKIADEFVPGWYPCAYSYEILGPFGFCSELAIHIHLTKRPNRDEPQEVHDEWWENGIKSVTFTPSDKSLNVRDYKSDNGKYQPGSIGYMNGMYYNDIDCTDWTYDDLFLWIEEHKTPEERNEKR